VLSAVGASTSFSSSVSVARYFVERKANGSFKAATSRRVGPAIRLKAAYICPSKSWTDFKTDDLSGTERVVENIEITCLKTGDALHHFASEQRIDQEHTVHSVGGDVLHVYQTGPSVVSRRGSTRRSGCSNLCMTQTVAVTKPTSMCNRQLSGNVVTVISNMN
jgi:hypothetical protein